MGGWHSSIAVACVLLSCCHAKENKTMNNSDQMLLTNLTLQLEKADADIAAQNWEAANQQLTQALAELGSRYALPHTIDESGMKLIAANLQEKEGKPDNAARVRRKIFAERLEMFKSKTQ